ncbi:MAG: SurA N-terminal domain-containing protein [Deltaproteobacteria bacterium]|nr:SurA N-terminal domain-containing protein [Deltaproteobacteria bacterium]
MLDTLRKHSKSALIYVFFCIIIVVFVFSFGPGSGGCRSGSKEGGSGETYAAMVNGETIPYADFQATYARIYKDYQNRAGGAFTEELARSIRLRDTVLDQLIDRELLAQSALEHGIAVSDQELAESIHKAFSYEGKFDPENYKLIIERQLGMTVWQYEEQERRRLAAQKMIASVLSSAKVSDDEVKAEFVREKEKLDLGFVKFAPAAYKAEVARPDDAAVDAYVKANAAKIEETYKSNSYRYRKPKRVKARHILVKVDEKATEAQAEAAKKKLVELKTKIAAGADFADEAKAVSEDTATKDKGGDLGEFGPGAMDPMFEKAAFALKVGEVSEPVRTRYGFHLVKVEEIKPEENKALKDVEKELAVELLIDEAAKAAARNKAVETLAQVKAGKTLEELWPPEPKKDEPSQAFKFDVGGAKPAASSTGPFSPSNDYVPQIGVDATLSRAVLGLDEKKPVADQPFEVNGSFFVVVLKSHEKPDFKQLEEKMDEFRDKARQKKAGEQLDTFLKALKEKAKIDKNQSFLSGSAMPGAGVIDG